ncbi:hypothetical protein MHD_02920 [Mannheimia granulomatis]|uniref:Uncharacterized protein n=1 Tax=Mannheimia granulomatis TaxID=85402 RepID=A0A011MKT9_9PAST|nr:hypothetical protein [Mannheimia granulomatis]EXI63106.1 hypothetical protein AK33_01495 [Mannheimia granulomatis]RGE48918.1 hypothetical protein MHD_02920 [Mannheimia granulomatis]
MRSSLGFIAICSFMVNDVYANYPSNHKAQPDYLKKSDNKQAFKISERKILKQAQNEMEEEVSSFSMEELRLGAQHIPDKAEVQYFKSQCRYAFMSDKDIIANRCEVKKVIRDK